MQKFKGRLLYMGWLNRPWKLATGIGDINLWPIIEKFLVSLNGKRANHRQERESYMLFATDNSEFEFKYTPGEYVLLEKSEGVGFSNVRVYLNDSLVWLSGRLVEIEIGNYAKFAADPAEEVFGVYFSSGNSCKVPEGAEKAICKVGKGSNCCVFLTGGSDGFYCQKFSGPMARTLLDRLAKGDTRAQRIGNCTILGRKEAYSKGGEP